VVLGDGVDQGDTGAIDQHAVFTVDPGGTTGVVGGYVELRPTMRQTMQTLSMAGSTEVHGSWDQQALEIAELWERFHDKAVATIGLPEENVHMAIEDFVLRRRQAGGATGNLTSCWVAAATVARCNLPSDYVVWQQPSEAKGFATNERLRMWGCYEVGSEHRRDAWRHFCSLVNKLIAKRW
jgi:hypothetical protein